MCAGNGVTLHISCMHDTEPWWQNFGLFSAFLSDFLGKVAETSDIVNPRSRRRLSGNGQLCLCGTWSTKMKQRSVRNNSISLVQAIPAGGTGGAKRGPAGSCQFVRPFYRHPVTRSRECDFRECLLKSAALESAAFACVATEPRSINY